MQGIEITCCTLAGLMGQADPADALGECLFLSKQYGYGKFRYCKNYYPGKVFL